MPIDHTSVAVSKESYQEQLKLYTEALKPLGYEIRMQFGPVHTGFGAPDSDLHDYKRADFWLTVAEGEPNYKVHVAFTARSKLTSWLTFLMPYGHFADLKYLDRQQVDAFHAAAVQNGGVDNGAPGLRPYYHSEYYAAFFTDSAGNNVECVCHHAPQ